MNKEKEDNDDIKRRIRGLINQTKVEEKPEIYEIPKSKFLSIAKDFISKVKVGIIPEYTKNVDIKDDKVVEINIHKF